MAFLGLVPGEDSSGEKHRRGRITDGECAGPPDSGGNGWHYQHRPGVGVALTRRRKGQPGRVIAIADKAQQRLCRRFRRIGGRTQAGAEVAVAIARELAGFLWAALQPVPVAGEVASTRQDVGDGVMMRFGDGPRRWRMIRGTNERIGGLAMRYGLRSQRAPLDCTSSRRSTVMRALPWATGVTTGYQRDSSSKRPERPSVFLAG